MVPKISPSVIQEPHVSKAPKELITNIYFRDIPYGPVAENPPSSAGDVASSPGQGAEISHAARQLSPCDTTTEPMCSAAHVTTGEQPVHHSEDRVCRN